MGRVDLIEKLLSEDPAAINRLNARKQTPLFVAAQNDQFDAVVLLVDQGADVNLADAVGTAALHRISQQCSDHLIHFLIDHGADAHLCCHVACGDVEGVKNKLQSQPDSAEEEFYGFNAVGYAIHSWHPDALRLLMQHGCPLSEEDQQHILRISHNDHSLLNELLTLRDA